MLGPAAAVMDEGAGRGDECLGLLDWWIVNGVALTGT
jgi:hypothetical protein